MPRKKDTVLVLRTCRSDMTAYEGFTWPKCGPVKCPDWDPAPRCGEGLHGLLWGVGDGSILDWSADARWLVVEVAAADVVDLEGKVKFPRGVVRFAGDRQGATDLMLRRAPPGTAVTGSFVTAGDWGTATAGNGGTATAGNGGTATAGDRGMLQCSWYDTRRRVATGYIGETRDASGELLIAGIAYRLDGQHAWVHA